MVSAGNFGRIPTQLLCEGASGIVDCERRHRQLRQVQMASAVLVLLRGIQVCRSESAEERGDNCSQLDWSVCRRRPRTSASRVIILWNHCRLQQQACIFHRLSSVSFGFVSCNNSVKYRHIHYNPFAAFHCWYFFYSLPVFLLFISFSFYPV